MFRSAAVFFLLFLSPLLFAEPLPLEYFLKGGDYLEVSLSPSGKRLAARARVDGRVQLFVFDRATGDVVSGIKPQRGSMVHTVEWVNDERLLFSYADDRLDLDAPVPTGELFAMNYDGKSREVLAGYRASDAAIGSRFSKKESSRSSFYLVNTLEEKDKYILVIEYPWSKDGEEWVDNRIKLPVVSRMNVYTGQTKTLETLPFRNATPYSTHDGEIRFVSYEKENGYSTAAYRENEKEEWQALSDVFELTGEMTVVGLNEAGDAAFLRGHYGEDSLYTIFRLDFGANTVEPVFADLDADIVAWIADPETGEVVAGVSMRGKPRYHYAEADSKIKAAHQKLVKAFGGQYIDIVSMTDGGEELMVRVSSDTNPGEYYVFNTDTNQAEFVWASSSWIDPRQMRPMLVDEVETDDGYRLPVLLTLPDGESPAPLIIHPHGGPHRVADHWGFNPDVQLLANHGYAVLQVNFRGSGDFGADFESAGYGEWGGKMIDDIATATRWAMEHPQIDGARICAYGASYGAYAAYMLAVREPELLKCTAGYGGVYDLKFMFTKGDIRRNWGGRGYLERVLGTDDARLNEFSPVNHADSIEAETLLIHGVEDNRVPIAHAKAMRRALAAEGNEPGWIQLDQSGHGAGSVENRIELYEGLLAFLDDNLK